MGKWDFYKPPLFLEIISFGRDLNALLGIPLLLPSGAGAQSGIVQAWRSAGACIPEATAAAQSLTSVAVPLLTARLQHFSHTALTTLIVWYCQYMFIQPSPTPRRLRALQGRGSISLTSWISGAQPRSLENRHTCLLRTSIYLPVLPWMACWGPFSNAFHCKT